MIDCIQTKKGKNEFSIRLSIKIGILNAKVYAIFLKDLRSKDLHALSLLK